MPKSKEIAFPHVVSKGSVTVRIYRTPSHNCESYTLSYYQDGVRKRPTFSTFDKAKDEADAVCLRLGRSDADVLLMKSGDRASYLRSRELLDPLGISLELAAAVVAMMRRELGDVEPAYVIAEHKKRFPKKLPFKPVQTVVDEFIAAKEADGASDRYVQGLKWSLGRFARRFNCGISVVSGRDIDQWLRESGLAPRTRNNLRNSVQALFNFAKARGYLVKDHAELDAVPVVKDGDGDIEVFTPTELREILGVAPEPLVPFLTLGAFAGVRHAEIQRLEWTDIRFDEGHIEIRASKAKTASRRIVPLVDNLRDWLKPLRKPEGSVCVHQDMASEIRRVEGLVNRARRAAWAKAAGKTEEELKEAEAQALKTRNAERKARNGKRPHKDPVPVGAETAAMEGWTPFRWKHNGLRHSFISYRVAETQNMAQVALEAGNSPQMIFKHYRELVTPKAAAEWFGIRP